MLDKNFTAIEAIRRATSLAGVDFIDNTFGLFNVDDDETSRFYRELLETTCTEVLRDYYPNNLSLFQEVVSLLESEILNGLYRYSYFEKGIFNILKVRANGVELYAVDNLFLLENTKDSYYLSPYALVTKNNYPSIDVLFIDAKVFLENPIEGDPLIRKDTLSNNGDIILLDKDLVTFKLAEKVMKYKQVAGYQVYSEDYIKRLKYLVEKNSALKKPLYI